VEAIFSPGFILWEGFGFGFIHDLPLRGPGPFRSADEKIGTLMEATRVMEMHVARTDGSKLTAELAKLNPR
jgi:hypothetical protein